MKHKLSYYAIILASIPTLINNIDVVYAYNCDNFFTEITQVVIKGF
ncbi:hypothetical protein PRVXT_001297 [Proteinivorax tanatarense]|uniref:Uncharacterized protein n=1 Tax=Proteinivorax tanatarense TaxID=1260629 RepID=A0AAU7VPW8_9FIRM